MCDPKKGELFEGYEKMKDGEEIMAMYKQKLIKQYYKWMEDDSENKDELKTIFKRSSRLKFHV